MEEDPIMAKSRDDSSINKAGNDHSTQRGKWKPERQSGCQSQDLEAFISAFMAQLSEPQRPDQALEEQSQHTQDSSRSAWDNTRPTSHVRCAVHTGCQLPSSLAEGWVALRRFKTELAAWDSDQAPFPPPMPKSCLIHWFCTAYENIAQMWQQLEPGLQRAMRDFRSPG
ncbi:hypothetical protein E8E11_004649 [Didymella keratinophila]|nr:hypothetical protein E8E11_004649 [Didymella keratinophila]